MKLTRRQFLESKVKVAYDGQSLELLKRLHEYKLPPEFENVPPEDQKVTIRFENVPFTITIQERARIVLRADAKDKGLQLVVEDQFTVEQIIDQYSEALRQKALQSQSSLNLPGLQPGDRLLLGAVELDEKKQIYKYGVKSGTDLTVEREDTTLPRFPCTCANCGTEVLLKRTDAVRCRSCGYRVLYKARKEGAPQYLAR